MDEGDHNEWAARDWLERVNQELNEDLSRAQVRIDELERKLAEANEPPKYLKDYIQHEKRMAFTKGARWAERHPSYCTVDEIDDSFDVIYPPLEEPDEDKEKAGN